MAGTTPSSMHTGGTIGELQWLGGELDSDDTWFVVEDQRGNPRTYRVRASQMLTRAQVMFCVPGTLSVDSDPAPWFICSMPNGLVMIATMAVVKTPPTGAPIAYDIWRSTDGVSWESIHTNSIAAGSYFSPEYSLDPDPLDPPDPPTVFTSYLVQHNQLLRLAVGGTGTTVKGADLTVSLRVYPL